MEVIGKRNFNYWSKCRSIAAYQFLTGELDQQKHHT